MKNAKGGWSVWRKLQRIWRILEVKQAPVTPSYVHVGEGSSSAQKKPAVQLAYLLIQLKIDPNLKDVLHRDVWILLKVKKQINITTVLCGSTTICYFTQVLFSH